MVSACPRIYIYTMKGGQLVCNSIPCIPILVLNIIYICICIYMYMYICVYMYIYICNTFFKGWMFTWRVSSKEVSTSDPAGEFSSRRRSPRSSDAKFWVRRRQRYPGCPVRPVRPVRQCQVWRNQRRHWCGFCEGLTNKNGTNQFISFDHKRS